MEKIRGTIIMAFLAFVVVMGVRGIASAQDCTLSSGSWDEYEQCYCPCYFDCLPVSHVPTNQELIACNNDCSQACRYIISGGTQVHNIELGAIYNGQVYESVDEAGNALASWIESMGLQTELAISAKSFISKTGNAASILFTPISVNLPEVPPNPIFPRDIYTTSDWRNGATGSVCYGAVDRLVDVNSDGIGDVPGLGCLEKTKTINTANGCGTYTTCCQSTTTGCKVTSTRDSVTGNGVY